MKNFRVLLISLILLTYSNSVSAQETKIDSTALNKKSVANDSIYSPLLMHSSLITNNKATTVRHIVPPFLAPSNITFKDVYHSSYFQYRPDAIFYYTPEGHNYTIEYKNVLDIKNSSFEIGWNDKK